MRLVARSCMGGRRFCFIPTRYMTSLRLEGWNGLQVFGRDWVGHLTLGLETCSHQHVKRLMSLISGGDSDEGSWRSSLEVRGPEQVVEALDQGGSTVLRERPHHAGEDLKSVSASPVF